MIRPPPISTLFPPPPLSRCEPATGPENMALDEALMDRARATGEWVLRVYSWSAPTISIGRHQSVRTAYDAETLADRKSTRLNSSHANISYAVFCLKKKKTKA